MAENCEKQNLLWRVANFVTIFVLIIFGFLFYLEFNSHKNEIQGKLVQLEAEIEILRLTLEPGKRFKRQVETANELSEDGIQIIEGSYSDEEKRPTVGLRVYDAWFQKGIPKNRRTGRNRNVEGTGNPIKPHHRKSASWVERHRKSKHDLNAHFDDKNVYRQPYPSGGKPRRRNQGAVDLPTKNRAKETDPENPSNSNFIEDPIRNHGVVAFATSRTSTTTFHNQTTGSGPGRDHHHHHHHRKHHRNKLLHNRNRLAESRDMTASASSVTVKSLRQPQSAGIGPIKDQFHGLLSVHFQGKKPEDNNSDGVFRGWDMARWAKRMNLNKEFIYNHHEGTVAVGKAGVYYIYAQVNYLDENDVNAFQILVNGESYLLCTVMTHTGSHSVTKANTCYTGGVVYLERDDEISVRDLETGRKSVIRPGHTFLGLVQLSGLDA